MATFRSALTDLAALSVEGVRSNYDLDALPDLLRLEQLPALLVMPIEQRSRLFNEANASLQTIAFSGSAKTVTYNVTHLLLTAPAGSAPGIRSHLPQLVTLIDAYVAAIAADVTLSGALLMPARVNIEPGVFPLAEREFYGCAFRHLWLMAL